MSSRASRTSAASASSRPARVTAKLGSEAIQPGRGRADCLVELGMGRRLAGGEQGEAPEHRLRAARVDLAPDAPPRLLGVHRAALDGAAQRQVAGVVGREVFVPLPGDVCMYAGVAAQQARGPGIAAQCVAGVQERGVALQKARPVAVLRQALQPGRAQAFGKHAAGLLGEKAVEFGGGSGLGTGERAHQLPVVRIDRQQVGFAHAGQLLEQRVLALAQGFASGDDTVVTARQYGLI